MENTIKSTPKDVFLQLFNIVTFYLSVIGFIMLYVQYINALLPDPLNYYFNGISETVRVASSILFIAVPAYLLSSWLLNKDISAVPERRELKLRKWLIYFTLFISAITIIVDLIIFVYNFLNGELTLRFFLKVLVVLLVAGAVFGYYFWNLKRAATESKLTKILAIAIAILALGSVVAGFFIVGTPGEQRQRRFDEQRLMDLQTIQGQVINYWTQKNTLPKNLIDLQDDISGFIVPNDPSDYKMVYSYNILGPLSFELCAFFETSDADFGITAEPTSRLPYDTAFQQNWFHGQGRTCFTRTIDPELYKPQKVNAEGQIPTKLN